LTKPVFALAERGLRRLEQEARSFAQAEADVLLPLTRSTDDSSRYVATTSRAAAVESIYTGVEAILKALLRSVREPVASEEARDQGGWHAQLLAQAAITTGTRPAILSDRTFAVLDELRKFRHIERNHYGHELRADRVAELSQMALAVVPDVIGEARAFMDAMSKPGQA
jgi:hypothetical protein